MVGGTPTAVWWGRAASQTLVSCATTPQPGPSLNLNLVFPRRKLTPWQDCGSNRPQQRRQHIESIESTCNVPKIERERAEPKPKPRRAGRALSTPRMCPVRQIDNHPASPMRSMGWDAASTSNPRFLDATCSMPTPRPQATSIEYELALKQASCKMVSIPGQSPAGEGV